MKVQFCLAIVLTTSSDVSNPQDAHMRAVPPFEELVDVPVGVSSWKVPTYCVVYSYRELCTSGDVNLFVEAVVGHQALLLAVDYTRQIAFSASTASCVMNQSKGIEEVITK